MTRYRRSIAQTIQFDFNFAGCFITCRHPVQSCGYSGSTNLPDHTGGVDDGHARDRKDPDELSGCLPKSDAWKRLAACREMRLCFPGQGVLTPPSCVSCCRPANAHAGRAPHKFNRFSDLFRLPVTCPQPCKQIMWTTLRSSVGHGISNAVW